MQVPRQVAFPIAAAALLAAVLSSPSGALGSSPFDPHFPFQTAILHLEFGGAASGGATVWVDGDRMARHEKRTMTVMGMGKTEERWTITTPESIVVWEVGEPTASRMENPAQLMREKYRALSAAERETVARNARVMGNVFMSGLGGGPRKKGKFLGYDVDIVEVMGTTQYLLAGTPLVVKQDSGMGGFGMSETATRIEANVPIPADKFALPDQVEIVAGPAGDMTKKMVLSTFESLKDPDFERKMRAGPAAAGAGPAAGTAAGSPGRPDMAEVMKKMQDPDMAEMMKRMQEMMKKLPPAARPPR